MYEASEANPLVGPVESLPELELVKLIAFVSDLYAPVAPPANK